MDELTKIVLTAACTIVGSVVVSVFGQFATRFVIDPYQEYRKTLGEIAFALVFYANVYSNPGKAEVEVMDERLGFFGDWGARWRLT